MSLYTRKPPVMRYSLRALALLLVYPDATLREHLPELRDALHQEAALGPARLAELDGLIGRLARRPGLEVEADYVETFDRGRGSSLHLFEHVHGDSRDRGPAMVDLSQTYEQAGLYLAPGELPDYLPVVLQYASTQPPAAAVALLGEISHLIRAIFSALLKRGSGHAIVLAALLELAGEKAEPVPVADEPDLDASWAEPVAFDGCSVQGQAGPTGQVGARASAPTDSQPIHVVRRSLAPTMPSGARPDRLSVVSRESQTGVQP